MYNIASISDADLDDKKVLLRLDLNVPIKNAVIEDETRIIESLNTIKFLLEKKCKIIIVTHLGRPDGIFVDDLKVDIIALSLEKKLGVKVMKLDESIGEDVNNTINNSSESVFLLENIRFYEGEEKNDAEFSKQLASLADVFVNDAFAVSHRAHASTVGVCKHLPSYAGFLLEKEIKNMSKLFVNPEKPLTLITGGAKIDTKIGILEHFIDIADYFIIGGALANTFLAAQGYNIGSSLYESNKLDIANHFLNLASNKNKIVILPTDVVVSTDINTKSDIVLVNQIGEDQKILDIGPKTISTAIDLINKSKTIVWNGPLGLYEYPAFAMGTKLIGEGIARSSADSIVGGGDTIDAVNKFDIPLESFSHVSTGGGAMLEFLEGKELPGISSLIRK